MMRLAYIKRVLSLMLILAMVLSVFPVRALAQETDLAVQAEQQDLTATVEKQIRAFADSIDQADADEAASLALAKHGITGGSKKLSAGQSHSLTATIFNSELMQVLLSESCAAAIELMQTVPLKEMNHIYGNVTWGLWEGSWGETNYIANKYFSSQHTDANIEYELASGLMLSSKANAYDKSLEWMVSYASVSMSVRQTQATDKEATYQVTCWVEDRFDFDTSQGSGFDSLLSGLASLLFREFDWESKVTFQLNVPNACSHSADFTSKVTAPTCSAQGYTTHTCSLCGYSYKDTYTAQTPHTYGQWTVTKTATCTEQGEECRDCANCGHYETRITDLKDHDYVDGKCSNCENIDPDYVPARLPGDVTGDGKVTATDYSRLLAHVKKVNLLTAEEELCAADVTGDGKITATDYSRLLAHVKKVNPLW